MSFEKWNAAHGSFDLDQRNREFSAWEASRAESEAQIAALQARIVELERELDAAKTAAK